MKKLMVLTILLIASRVFATVSDGATVRQSFSCDGANTIFTFTFKCNSSDDVLVYAPLTSTGDPEAALTIDVDYTIAATGGSYLNGGVVTIAPALASTYTVQIVRSIKQSQETVQGAITPTSIVAALDKLTRAAQDLKDRKDRSIHIPDGDSVAFDMTLPNSVDRAETFIFFDSAGNLTTVTGISETGIASSAFGQSLIVTADAAAAATLLELGTLNDVEFAGITGTTGAFSGTLAATGNVAVNTNKFTVTAASGNTLVAGTFNVTGNTTLAGTLTSANLTLAAGATVDTISTDTSLAGNLDTNIVTQKAIKTYADAAPKAQMKADNVAGATFGVGVESCTLPNGMIIKTGYSTTDGTTTITFTDAFPSGITSVNATTVYGLAPEGGIAVNTVSVTKFDVECSAGFVGFYWTAIGY